MVVMKLINPSGNPLRPCNLCPELTSPDDEVEAAATVLYDSLNSNPFLRASSDWNPDLLRMIMRGRVAVGAKDESVYVSVSDLGVIDGVMYLNPPGVGFGQARNTPEGPPRYRERMRPETKEWLEREFGPWYIQLCKDVWGETGSTESVYVNLLGVAPSAQKKRIGAALLQAAHDLADEAGVIATLGTQTESNMKWYRKAGWEVDRFEDVDIKGTVAPCWMMTRRAKAVKA